MVKHPRHRGDRKRPRENYGRSYREMGAGVRCGSRLRMTCKNPPGGCRVTLAPRADELLSSWIGRHAEFYGVPPLAMLRHCLQEAPSLRTADSSCQHILDHAQAERQPEIEQYGMGNHFRWKPVATIERITCRSGHAARSHIFIVSRLTLQCRKDSSRIRPLRNSARHHVFIFVAHRSERQSDIVFR